MKENVTFILKNRKNVVLKYSKQRKNKKIRSLSFKLNRYHPDYINNTILCQSYRFSVFKMAK